MKKFLVVSLILLQISWTVKVEGINCSPQDTVILPSITTLIKIVYVSVKSNIKNIVNLVYIFSSLPQKKEETQPGKVSIVLFFVSENKKKMFVDFLPLPHIYYYDIFNCLKPVGYLTNLVTERMSFGITESLYYFSKPRSSI